MKGGEKVLLVEDDAALSQSLCEQLELHEEFAMSAVASGAEGLQAIKTADFDLIILDVGLPDMDGTAVCRLMRRSGFNSPIIMLTGADGEADTILGLDSGANDYVTKPFQLSVLLARIRAQLRQHERSEDAVFSVGPYTYRSGAKLLIDNESNEKIRLTEKESAILKFLCRSANMVISPGVLLSEVWGYNREIDTHTLQTHIYRLRQKIEHDPSNAELLVTEPGGYRLFPERRNRGIRPPSMGV